MNFITAVKTCFRKYFKFKGRARRSEFWYWVLFTIIMNIVLVVFDNIIFGASFEGDDLQPLSDSFALVTLFPGVTVSWRRLHDINRSGWWVGGGYLAVIIFASMMLAATAALTMSNVDFSTISLISFSIIGVILGLGLFFWTIILLVFFCTDTKLGDNRFGEDPKYGRGASVFD